jgi:PKD repeat protein
VTDAKGLKSTATGQVVVKATPLPVITYSPKKPLTTDDVHFSGQKSKVDGGKIVRWEWECRGAKTTRIDSNDIKKGLPKYKARCKFGKAKNYEVSLTVTADGGEKATLTQYVPIKLKRPPWPSLTFSPDNPEQDQTVTFDASKSKSDPLGDGEGITSYRWEFSDGTDETTTTPIFKHKFTGAVGTRKLTLTVKDKEGKNTIERSVYVYGKCLTDVVIRGLNVRADCLRETDGCGEKGTASCFRSLPGMPVKLNGVELRPPSHAGMEIYESGRVTAGYGSNPPLFHVMFGQFQIAQRGEFTIPAGGGPKTPDGDWAIDTGTVHGLKFATDPLVFHPDGTSMIGANVQLPSPFNAVSGRVDLSASNDGDPYLGALHIEAHDIPLTPFHLNSAIFDYNEAADRWYGAISVQSPSGTFGGDLEVLGGSLNHLGLFGDDLNYPMGYGVFLQRVAGSYTVKPAKHIHAEVGMSVGPQLSIPGTGTGNLMGFTGTFDLTFPSEGGWNVALGGSASMIGVEVGQIDASLSSAGRFAANAHFNTTLYGVFDVNANLGLIYYDPSYFSSQAKIDICTKYIVHECAGGELVISSVGIGVCIYLPGVLPNVGGYYNWNSGDVEFFFRGCSVGPVAIQIARIRSAQSRSFTVRKGATSEAIQLVGQDGPPNVTLVGPKGERVATPADGYELSNNAMVSQEAKDKSTYILLGKPSPGKWTVEVAPGSTPVVQIKRAQGLPEPSVKGKVSGSGARRTLTYSARPVKGQRLEFFEQGEGRKKLGSSTKARGTLAFTPSDGPKGRRTIMADVVQDGRTRATLKVATYTAPRVAPGRPGAVRLRRNGSSLVASWGRSAGATGYAVQVTLSDGRRIPVLTTKRTVTVPGLAKTEGATVTVAGYRVAGLLGPAAKTSLKPPKPKKRT